MSNSLQPDRLYSPGQTTGVGSHSLLQGIFPTQGSNPGLLHCRQILYQLSLGIYLQYRRRGVDSWVGKIPWRREWLPISVLLHGEFHERRSLVGYSPGGHKESDMIEQLTFHFRNNLISIIWELNSDMSIHWAVM